MFCDGKCKTKRKQCGLYITETLQEAVSGKVKNEEKCLFVAIYGSSIRIEQKLGGLHAAENSSRNEAVAQSQELKEVVTAGFVGLIREARKLNSVEVKEGQYGGRETDIEDRGRRSNLNDRETRSRTRRLASQG